MTDIRTIIAELRESYADIKSSDGTGYYVARDFFLGKCEHLPRLLDYIAKMESVADAAEVVYAEWGEEEIACEFEEWRNLRSALDATNCDIKNGGAE